MTALFGFNITGTSNLVIVVEASTNLVNPAWQPIQTNTLTGGTSYFSDPQWTNYPSRYYREYTSRKNKIRVTRFFNLQVFMVTMTRQPLVFNPDPATSF